MKQRNICGARIKEARLNKKLKQVDLVAALSNDYGIEMDRSALARIENLDRTIPDYELIAISEILDVTIEWLFAGKKRLSE